ncbi:hypothetical protein AB1N83_008389 [Pleurotus pulmonarius]
MYCTAATPNDIGLSNTTNIVHSTLQSPGATSFRYKLSWVLVICGDAVPVHGRGAFSPPIGSSVRLKNTNDVKNDNVSEDAKKAFIV